MRCQWLLICLIITVSEFALAHSLMRLLWRELSLWFASYRRIEGLSDKLTELREKAKAAGALKSSSVSMSTHSPMV